MSKIIDLTDKLNFKEKPIVRIKDIDVNVNDDAISVLKIAAYFSDEGSSVNANDILNIYDTLFDKAEKEKIESLKLNMEDFSTFIVETAKSLVSGDDEGETQTPDMT